MITIKRFYFFFPLLALLGCSSSEITYKFEATMIDIGKVTKGKESVARFEFKNVGKNEILIKEVKLDCHCTKANYSKEKIKSGQTGFVHVFYDNHKIGFFEQTINVYFNNDDNPPVLLLFRGIVENK